MYVCMYCHETSPTGLMSVKVTSILSQPFYLRLSPGQRQVLGRTIFYYGMSFKHKQTENYDTEIFERTKNEDDVRCTI